MEEEGISGILKEYGKAVTHCVECNKELMEGYIVIQKAVSDLIDLNVSLEIRIRALEEKTK